MKSTLVKGVTLGCIIGLLGCGEVSGAISYRSASTWQENSAGTNSIVLSAPSGVQVGDLLLATMNFGYGSNTLQPTLTPPSGWTLVRRINHGTVSSLAVFWHFYAAGETTYTWTVSGHVIWGAGDVLAYAGVNTSPIDVDAGQDNPAAGTSYSTPSITTTGANEVLVATFAGLGNTGANTWSAPSGTTQRASVDNTIGRTVESAEKLQATAGASGVLTATVSPSQVYAMTHLLALRPASAPSGIAYVGSSTWITTSGTNSIVLSAPSGTQVGHLLLAAIEVGYGSNTLVPALIHPKGWTAVKRIDHGLTGTFAVFWHAYAQGETSYTWTLSGPAVWGSAYMLAYSGVNLATPIDVGAGQNVQTAGTSYSTPSITTLGSNEMLVATFAGLGNSGANTWTAPSGTTQRAMVDNTIGRSIEVVDKLQASCGASGALTSTVSASQSWAITHVLALIPASGSTACPTLACTYHSDQTASASNTACSAASPCNTIAKGIAKLTPGTTLCVHGAASDSGNAVWNEAITWDPSTMPNGTDDNNRLTIRAYPGDIVRIQGVNSNAQSVMELLGVWTTPTLITDTTSSCYLARCDSTSSRWLTFKNLIFDGRQLVVATANAVILSRRGVHHIRYENVEVRNSPMQGLSGPGEYGEILNSSFHNNGKKTGDWTTGFDNSTFGNTTPQHGVYLCNRKTFIQGGLIYHNHNEGIHLWCGTGDPDGSDNNIDGVELYDIGNAGEPVTTAGVEVGSGQRNVVQSVIAHDIPYGVGVLVVKGANKTIISNSTIYNNANSTLDLDGGIYIGQWWYYDNQKYYDSTDPENAGVPYFDPSNLTSVTNCVLYGNRAASHSGDSTGQIHDEGQNSSFSGNTTSH